MDRLTFLQSQVWLTHLPYMKWPPCILYPENAPNIATLSSNETSSIMLMSKMDNAICSFHCGEKYFFFTSTKTIIDQTLFNLEIALLTTSSRSICSFFIKLDSEVFLLHHNYIKEIYCPTINDISPKIIPFGCIDFSNVSIKFWLPVHTPIDLSMKKVSSVIKTMKHYLGSSPLVFSIEDYIYKDPEQSLDGDTDLNGPTCGDFYEYIKTHCTQEAFASFHLIYEKYFRENSTDLPLASFLFSRFTDDHCISEIISTCPEVLAKVFFNFILSKNISEIVQQKDTKKQINSANMLLSNWDEYMFLVKASEPGCTDKLKVIAEKFRDSTPSYSTRHFIQQVVESGKRLREHIEDSALSQISSSNFLENKSVSASLANLLMYSREYRKRLLNLKMDMSLLPGE